MGKNNVLVAVRARPLNQREVTKGAVSCVQIDNNAITITDHQNTGEQRQYTFDYTYEASGNPALLPGEQQEIFDNLGTWVVKQANEGFNVTVMAYGQTGAGKSLTMVGKPSVDDSDNRGLIPRISEAIFNNSEVPEEGAVLSKMHLKMMEIYNEQVRDLLAEPGRGHNLKVREDPQTGPYVEGLTKHQIKTYEGVCEKLEAGLQARSVAETQMNAGSSRAHTICQLEYTHTKLTATTNRAVDTSSLINLVDLAGSERVSEAGTAGDAARYKESVNINKSLTALGLCIRALSEKESKKQDGKHIPYRDSALTFLLKNSLGGNAKTIMIAALSPGSSEYQESLSTLRYADCMRRVQTAAVVNRRSVLVVPNLPEKANGGDKPGKDGKAPNSAGESGTSRAARASSARAKPRGPAAGAGGGGSTNRSPPQKGTRRGAAGGVRSAKPSSGLVRQRSWSKDDMFGTLKKPLSFFLAGLNANSKFDFGDSDIEEGDENFDEEAEDRALAAADDDD